MDIKNDWRKGQLAFNVWFAVDPAGADEIRATDADPYYNDDNLERFWFAVERRRRFLRSRRRSE